MKFFTNLVLQSIVSLVISYGLVSYVPLNYFPDVIKHTFGSTITTIQGSDTISGSRTTINTNFSNLNTDKAENTVATLASLTSASSLATVGTITGGTWTGSIIGATYGGTGSSTLSSNQILLGNGTGVVKTVNGFGTSGQFLTSNGAGVAPTFQSATVDQTQNYTWTGLHTFNSSGFIDNASSTFTAKLNINGAASTRYGISGIATSSSITQSSTPGAFIWNKPDGANIIHVELWGGGGGSGGVATNHVSGGGGGGGYMDRWMPASLATSTVACQVGTGGLAGTAGDTAGGTGGSTVFGTTLLTAVGGNPSTGASGVTNAPGGAGGGAGVQWVAGTAGSSAGGAGGSADYGGGGGGGSDPSGTGNGGIGGNSFYGGGGGGGESSLVTGTKTGGVSTFEGGSGGASGNNTVGTAGSSPGGGGGGSASNAGGNRTGAVGGNGMCRITTYF